MSDTLVALSKRENVRLVNTGQFYYVDENEKLNAIDEYIIFGIVDRSKYDFYIQVFTVHQ